jgi:hypothetical protein
MTIGDVVNHYPLPLVSGFVHQEINIVHCWKDRVRQKDLAVVLEMPYLNLDLAFECSSTA